MAAAHRRSRRDALCAGIQCAGCSSGCVLGPKPFAVLWRRLRDSEKGIHATPALREHWRSATHQTRKRRSRQARVLLAPKRSGTPRCCDWRCVNSRPTGRQPSTAVQVQEYFAALAPDVSLGPRGSAAAGVKTLSMRQYKETKFALNLASKSI